MLLGRVGERLELTDEQREQIKAVLEESKPTDTKDTIAEAMKALREATAGGKEAEIIAAGKAVGDAFTQRALKQAETMKKIKEILTDEQKVKLEEIQAKMKERMQQRREGNFDGPPRRRNNSGRDGDDRGPRRDAPRWD
jgi:Spy/CpxP family protein refolding chaperone